MARRFQRTCEELLPHLKLIEAIAFRLEMTGALSGRTVAALCREH
jgi:hypothetical protein